MNRPILMTLRETARLTMAPMLFSFGLALALPAMILTAMKLKNAWIMDDPAMMMIHCVFLNMSALLFGLPIFFHRLQPPKQFLLPVSGSFLAVCHLGFAAMVGFAQALVYGLVLNGIFGLAWPVVGPALFMGVAFVSLLSLFWTLGHSLWALPGMIVLIGGEFFWLKTRYGSLLGGPDHPWNTISLLDGATLAMAFVGSLVLGSFALSWNRSGAPVNTTDLETWLLSFFNRKRTPNLSFTGPWQAQFWAEWNGKGWVLPLAALGAMAVTLTLWALIDRQLPHLYHAWAMGGGFLVWVGYLAGIALGNLGAHDPHSKMGSFLASRPVTCRSLAWITLTVGALSLASAWLAWVVSLGLVRGLLWLADEVPLSQTASLLVWWWLPGWLLGAWAAMGANMVLLAMGQDRKGFLWPVALFLVWLLGLLGCSWSWSPLSPEMFNTAFCALLGLGLGATTLGCLIRSLGLGIIPPRFAVLAVAVWLALAWGAWWVVPGEQEFLGGLRFLLAGATSLVVFPVVAGPLAVAANRTR